MTYKQFFYTLGLSALVSLAISIGVTSYMLKQRVEAPPVKVVVDPASVETVKRNKLLAEANVLIEQTNLDLEMSRYSGVEVIDVYKAPSILDAKVKIEGAKNFCGLNNARLTKIKFYEAVEPLVRCSNGVTN